MNMEDIRNILHEKKFGEVHQQLKFATETIRRMLNDERNIVVRYQCYPIIDGVTTHLWTLVPSSGLRELEFEVYRLRRESYFANQVIDQPIKATESRWFKLF